MKDENKKSFSFLSISFWILVVTAVLMPFFFLPGGALSLSLSKSIFVYTGVSLSSIFVLLHVFKSGKFYLPNSFLLTNIFLVLGVFFLSSVVGGRFMNAFIGYGFEIGTFGFMFLFFSVLFLSMFLFQKDRRIDKLSIIFLLPFTILGLIHLFKFFFGWDLLSFGGVFADKVNTSLGGFNELSILAGAAVMFSVIMLDNIHTPLSKSFWSSKVFYWISFVVGIILLIIVNFPLSWILLLILSLLFIFLKFYKKDEGVVATRIDIPQTSQNNVQSKNVGQDIVFQNKTPEVMVKKEVVVKNYHKKPIVSFVVVILALLFIFPTGGLISQKINNLLGINYTEVRLSMSGTGGILSRTLRQDGLNFMFGSGPNTFSSEWKLGKPESVNLTNFWNTDFQYATGLIPTFFVTTGFLGIVTWLLFLISFISLGLKYVFLHPKNIQAISFFFVTLYLWLISIFYLPSHFLLILTAIFSGVFLAITLMNHDTSNSEGKTVNNIGVARGRNAIFIFVLIIFVAVNLLTTFYVYKKAISAINFEKGFTAFDAGNLAQAEESFKKALAVSENDVYRRYLSEFYMVQVRKFAQEVKEPTEDQIKSFQDLFQNAIQNIQLALSLNPDSLENRIQLGKIYQFLAEIKTEEAFDTSKNVYMEAKKLDPNNPLLDFLLANLEVSSGSLDEALKDVNNAIGKKPNFGDALLLHSRVKFLQGDIDGAITSGINAINVFPQESYLYFHLGLLYYQKEDYKNAFTVLNEAITLVPDFANARYFAGLSLYKLGKTAESLEQFNEIEKTNPENPEIKLIIENLKAGKEPLFNAKPPADVNPEKRSELPLTDEKSGEKVLEKKI